MQKARGFSTRSAVSTLPASRLFTSAGNLDASGSIPLLEVPDMSAAHFGLEEIYIYLSGNASLRRHNRLDCESVSDHQSNILFCCASYMETRILAGSAAAFILIMDRAPEGAEKIKGMLVTGSNSFRRLGYLGIRLADRRGYRLLALS